MPSPSSSSLFDMHLARARHAARSSQARQLDSAAERTNERATQSNKQTNKMARWRLPRFRSAPAHLDTNLTRTLLTLSARLSACGALALASGDLNAHATSDSSASFHSRRRRRRRRHMPPEARLECAARSLAAALRTRRHHMLSSSRRASKQARADASSICFGSISSAQ